MRREFYRSGTPKPALLFSLQKRPCGPHLAGRTLRAAFAKRLAPEPPSAGQTYFEPGVLQLPTVKQIKRLYNSVQNRFYKQVQKGAFNSEQQQLNGTSKEENGALFFAVQNSTRIIACSMIFQI